MIAIPNMSKPKSCYNHCLEGFIANEEIGCPLNDYIESHQYKSKTHPDCPLIEIDESEMEYLYREFGLEKDENLTNGAKELKRAILMGYLYAKKDIVRCGECKHRPIKDDPDGADYGFNIVEPTDGDDLCPCLVEDGWYSWMPKDNFYCGRGERRADD